MKKENCLNRRMYDISKHAEFWEILLVSLGICLVPVFIPTLLTAIFGEVSSISSNSQFIVGTIVNTSLIITGINVKGIKKVIGLVTLPSISNMLSGLIFQSTSIFLVYMIPAIWVGNFILIYIYKKLYIEKQKNYVVSSIIGIILKVAAIFGGFNLLVILDIIPKSSPVATVLFSAMGINQLITAMFGSIAAFAILKIIYSKQKNKGQ